jgi:hypothetical protein
VRRVGLLVASILAACADGRPRTVLPPGNWGGEHVSLTVSDTGATVEFDCAHGTVEEAFRLDVEGGFNLNGAYVREHGGPSHDGEPEDRHPASYFGRLQGSRVTLSVRLTDDGTEIGPFTAVHGQPPGLFKCL